MSLVSYVSDSELFRQVTSKKPLLRHPTATAFDPMTWLEAAKAINPPKRRDFELVTAAIYFSNSIQKAREAVSANLIEPFTKETGTKLLVSVANEQYISLTRKLRTANRRLARTRETGNLLEMAATPVASRTGQAATADQHITGLIDALPHWLFHLRDLPSDKRVKVIADPFGAARNALLVASLERSLKDLWQATFWEGRRLIVEDRAHHLVHHDNDMAVRWMAWEMRDQMNMLWETGIDVAAVMMAGPNIPPITPVQPRTVVAIERQQNRKPRLVVGSAKGNSPRQRNHLSQRDMLDRLYTGIFLDEILPATGQFQLSCRELCRAWWVLTDLAAVLLNEIGESSISNASTLARCAFTWPLDALITAIANALEVDKARSRAIVELFTLNPTSTSSLFKQSLWWTPVIPAEHERVHLLVAPLLTGNLVRLVEHWLDIGGFSDRRAIKGRGSRFEAHVRETLKKRLISNHLIKEATVLPHALKRKGDSEEIDLLVRIGKTVLIGEVKCFLSPTEPQDRFNYLKEVEEAAKQARRKLEWVDANRTTVLGDLGVDTMTTDSVALVPVVILNQGNGLGLLIEGVPVTDLHFLELVLGSSEYQTEMAVVLGRSAGSTVTLYQSQAELESCLAELLANPPTLPRFISAIGWTTQPFPSPNDKPLLIHTPSLQGKLIQPSTAAELLALLKPA